MSVVTVRKRETALAGAFVALLWPVLLLSTRTVFSGYHFLDDFQILDLDTSLSQSGFWTTLLEAGKLDIGFRFRPLYTVHRVVETAVFSDNFLAWSCYTVVLAMLTSLCLFWFGRNLGLRAYQAAIFVLLVLLGAQSPIWWRLGPNETIGMVILSISLLFLSLYYAKNKALYRWFFVAFALIASLAKESFVLLLPALMFALVWADHHRKNSWREAARRNLAPLLVLGVIMCVELATIVFFIGTDDLDYAGLSGIGPASVYHAGLRLLQANFYYVPILVLGAALIWTNRHRRDWSEVLVRHIPLVVLLVLVVGPQLLLYAESGIAERYLLPGALGVALLMVYLFRHLARDRLWIRMLAAASLVLVMAFQFYTTTVESRSFARTGFEIDKLLTAITTGADSTTPILIAADPADHFEPLRHIKTYMDYEHKGDLYLDLYTRDDYSDFEQARSVRPIGWYDHKTLDQVPDKQLLPRVVILGGLEEEFLDRYTQDWFHPSAYVRTSFDYPGATVLYLR